MWANVRFILYNVKIIKKKVIYTLEKHCRGLTTDDFTRREEMVDFDSFITDSKLIDFLLIENRFT